MSDKHQATFCIFAQGDAHEQFKACFHGVLKHTPQERVELRLAFAQSRHSFQYTLGVLVPDNAWPARQRLPGAVDRFHFAAIDGRPVWVWHSPGRLTREQLAKLLFHDATLTTEYAICLDQAASVEAGWWDTLAPHMERGIDYIGQPRWHEYTASEAERVQMQPWYMGVPLSRREGRLGVAYMDGGLMAVRSERLQGAEYPGEVMLGEMANQMGWTQGEFEPQRRRGTEQLAEGFTAEIAETAERRP
jgi:hypothetical protein